MEVMQNSVYPGAEPVSIKMALMYCKGDDLDPLQKPVHIVPMSVKTKVGGEEKYVKRDVIMPGINRHRVQAARSGEYAGQSEPEFGPMHKLTVTGENGQPFELPNFEYPEWCRLTVYRLVGGEPRPFPVIAYWLENYATKSKDSMLPNDMWKRRARAQLEKCAEAQALRKAFPERAGAPTAEEMAGRVLNDDDTIEGTATERRELPREPKPKNPPATAAAEPTDQQGSRSAQPGASQPQQPRSGGGPADNEDMTGERRWIEQKIKQRGIDLAPLLQKAGIESLDKLTPKSFDDIKRMLLEAA
jgi:phage recombination protein Bet